MTKFLFFLTVLFSSLLLAQETTSAPKTEASAPTEVTSPSPAAGPSSAVTPPAVTPASEATNSSPSAPTVPLPATETAAPVDPSGEASPDSTSPNAAATPSEEAAGMEATAPASEQAAEPLKAPLEKPSEGIEKKEEQIKIRYYQVRTRVENDPEVAATKQQANTAVSEEKKRQALRAYYELLFKKMKSLDASISERCDIMEAAYLRRLEQTSLEPTIPLTPLESPSSAVKKKEATSVEPAFVPVLNAPKKKKH